MNVLDFNNAFKAKELEAYLKPEERDEGKVDRIRAGLNASAESFVADIFPAAVFDRGSARIANVHGDPGFSLVIETRGAKAGVWKDFGDPDQKGGDLIGLYMAAKRIPFVRALDELSDWLGNGTRPEVSHERQRLVSRAKRVERDLGPPKGEWHYTDADGTIIASVYRFEPETGGKEYLPWDAVRRRWGNPDLRPLYNVPGILQAQRVIFCEGEKAAQALIDLGYAATSVMGGSSSPLDKTDLTPLAGKDVILWPDNDEPGRSFGAGLQLVIENVVGHVAAPDDAVAGWDAADAVAEGRDIASLLGDAPTSPTPVLPFFWFEDATPTLETNDFVEGLLTSSAMSVVYGPSNCGKTFFVLDLALHIAMGIAWRGRECDQGAVVYLSLEGAQGIRNRLAAFRKHHALDGVSLPFIAMPRPVNLLNDAADVAAVIQLVEHVAERSGLPVRLVIIDTLSRAIAGGNENSSEDMTALIGNCDRIRNATGAHVCIIHHSGKDEARGARGHSSLRAATDTEIEIKKDELGKVSTVRVAKQRDLEAADPFAFSLIPITLGTNGRGKEVTSCIVQNAEAPAGQQTPTYTLTPKEDDAFRCLLEALAGAGFDHPGSETMPATRVVSLDHWKTRLLATSTIDRNNADAARSAYSRFKKTLVNKGFMEVAGDMAWACETGETRSETE